MGSDIAVPGVTFGTRLMALGAPHDGWLPVAVPGRFEPAWAIEGDAPESAGGRHDARDWQERSEHQNSNEVAAQAIARYLLGRRLTQGELRFAAPLMHYLFGATVGAI